MADENKKYDIVFIIDTSGSMSDKIVGVKNNLKQFVKDLDSISGGAECRLGLIEYELKASIKCNLTDCNLTDDTTEFLDILQTNTSGSLEYGLNAINEAINNMNFNSESQKEFILVTDEDYDDNANVITASDIENTLNENNIRLDVFGTKGLCETAWQPIANATKDTNGITGKFYYINSDFSSIFKQLANEITGHGLVNVDLNSVTNETGVFVIASNNTESNVTASFKVTAEDGDLVVGEINSNKVYTATSNTMYDDSDTSYRQNIVIPEDWNVTATENADILNVEGLNVTITSGSSGLSNDVINISSDVTNVTITDFDTADALSFGNYIQPGDLKWNIEEETRFYTEDNVMNLTIENINDFINNSDLNTTILSYSVGNGDSTNTISELLGKSLSTPTATVNHTHKMSFANNWSYKFTPSSNN